MPCDYPHCVGAQSGTTCRDECKSVQTACHGPCKQGALRCPTPESCELPDRGPVNIKVDLLLAATLVAAILFIVWVLA